MRPQGTADELERRRRRAVKLLRGGLGVCEGARMGGGVSGGMRPQGTADELERRRRRAVKLLRGGLGVCEVARMVGASPGSVTTWREGYDRDGAAGPKARRH